MATRHYERERELQDRIGAVLRSVLPEIRVVEVELNDPREKVTVYIDRAEGIRLEDCEAVTHAIRDTCPDHALEVSSPGIERPLREPADFREAVGERVRLRQAGRHRASVVQVVEVEDSGVMVAPVGATDADRRLVPFVEVVRCKLVVEDPFATVNQKGAQ
ncbi:MAG: ribosome maturation factor RimP [Thermoleophilia bacterium]|nr:ribosome maturation factor RimP [Thermoleophilia bacterium]